MILIYMCAALLQLLSYFLYNRVFHPFQDLMTDTDPKEPNQIPLVVIHAANDQNEGKQDEQSQEEGEPKENSSGLADAIETPELDVEVEPLLNGKSNSLHFDH